MKIINGSLKRVSAVCISVIVFMLVSAFFALETKGELSPFTFSAQAAAVDSGTTEGLTWTLDSEGILTVEGEGPMPDYAPTEKIEDMVDISEIYAADVAPWMEYYKDINGIVIKEGITRIGSYAFSLCYNIKEISFPDSLTEIGEGAFVGCVYLENLELNKVETVGTYAFAYCINLKNVDFAQIKNIGAGSFAYCVDLQEISIPEGVTTIPENTFYECTQVSSIVIPSTVTTLPEGAFGYMPPFDEVINKSSSVSFFETVELISFRNKEEAQHFLFTYAEMGKLNMLTELDIIRYDEIYETEEELIDLIRIKFNEKFSLSLEFEEFYEYINELDSNMTGKVPPYLKVYCPDESAEHTLCKQYGITHYLLGEDEEHFCFEVQGEDGNISWSVDRETKTLTLSGSGEMENYDGVSAPWHILSNYFDKVVFAQGSEITSIGDYAFFCTGVKSVEIPDTVKTIGESAFRESQLESLVVPSTVESIGDSAFRYCYYLNSVTFKENSSLTELGYGVFYYCSSLTEIEIPEKVASISDSAFKYCSSLEKITVQQGNEAFVSENGILYNTDKTVIVAFPQATKGEIVIPSGVATLSDSAFYECNNITKVSFEEGTAITNIPSDCFSYCDKLETVIIPDSVTVISSSAFSGCSKLKNVVFGENSSLTTINSNAFSWCNSLEEIELPASLTSLSERAFRYCNSLNEIKFREGNTSYAFENGMVFNKDKTKLIFCLTNKVGKVIVPGSVTYISDNAFSNCSYLTEVEFGEGINLSQIPYFAFSYSSLRKITIPASVSKIRNEAFYYCRELEEVIFEEGSCLTGIESYAFYRCEKLKSIVIPESCSNISYNVFSYCDKLESVTVLNKECSISYDGYYQPAIPSTPKIIGYSGSTAQDYANLNGNVFEALDEKVLESVTVATMPYKTIYKKGFPFISNGLTVSLNYSDGTSIVKTNSFVTEGFDSSEVGKCTVYVSYAGIKGSFEVEIVDFAEPVLKAGAPATVYVAQGETIGYKFTPKVSGTYSFTVEKESENEYLNATLYNSDESYMNSTGTSGKSSSFSQSLNGAEEYTLNVYFSSNNAAGDVTVTVNVISVDCSHNNTEDFPEIPADCNNTGFTAGTYCYDCETWTQGHEFIDITHVNSDEEDIYCDLCGDDIRKVLETGECGSDATYIYYDNGDLEISGTGEIDDCAFRYMSWNSNSLRNVIIGEGITHIGSYVFEYIFIKRLYLPSTLESVAQYAFYNSYYHDEDIDRDKGFNTYVNDISTWLNIEFENNRANPLACCGYLYVKGEKTTQITVPETVTEIKKYAFYNNDTLENITFHDKMTSVGKYAFYDCDTLKEITLPDSITEVGTYAFYSCDNVERLAISDKLTSLEYYAFSYLYKLSYLKMPASLSDTDNMFSSSYIEEIVLTKGTGSVNYTSSDHSYRPWYDSCSRISKLTVEEGVERIGAYSFYNMSSLKEISLPESLTYIGSYAFYNCDTLSKLDLPENTETIESYAFSNLNGLTWVILNENLKTVGSNAFYNSSIGAAAYRGTQSQWASVSVASGNTNLTDKLSLYDYNDETDAVVNSGTFGTDFSYDVYFGGRLEISGQGEMKDFSSSGMPWYSYRNGITDVEIGEGITKVGENAFYGFSNLENVTLPETLTSIGYYAFYNCHKLSSINFPEALSSIGYSAFYNCAKLKEVYLGKNMESLGSGVFRNCRGIEAFTVSTENQYYSSENGVLYNKDKTTLMIYPSAKEASEFNVPDSVTGIDSYAFSGTIHLKKVVVPDTVTSIPSYAFADCSSLEEIKVPVSSCTQEDTFTGVMLKKLTLSKGTGKMADFSSRSNVPWHSSYETLEALTVEEGVTHIGKYAFDCFYSLRSVKLPDSLTSIGAYAFTDCWRITELMLPSGITAIGDYAFSGCGEITELVLPSELKSIGDYAFEDCSGLREVVIPSGVSSIGEGAFSSCSNLKLSVSEDNPYFCIESSGILFNKDKTVLVSYPSNLSASSYTVPDTVKAIGNSAFRNNDNLNKVNLPKGLTEIGAYAFYDCYNLRSITVPEGVTQIGDSTFASCYYLDSVVLPEGLTKIGNNAFNYCRKLTQINFPEGLTSIGSNAFYYCTGLAELDLPDSLTAVGSYAFQYCSNVTDITIPASAVISSGSFNSVTSVKNITITAGNGNMCNYDSSTYTYTPWYQSRNSLESLTLSEGIKNIGSYAFAYNTLSNIELPESLNSVGTHAFYKCTGLQSVTLPGAVTSTGDYAFCGCSGLENVVMGKNITSIENYAFSGCSALKTISLPEKLTSIGNYAFNGCSLIKDIVIPEGTTSIGSEAFRNCSGLENVVIADTVTSLGDYAFSSCSNIKYLKIPVSLSVARRSGYYGNYSYYSAFGSTTGLEEVEFTPGTGEGASYYSCYEYTPWYLSENTLKKITFAEGIKSLGAYLFADNDSSALSCVVLPKSLTSFTATSFRYANIRNLDFGKDLSYVSGEFHLMRKLERITVDPENEEYFSDDAGAFFDKAKAKLIQYPPERQAALYEIPDGVTEIDSYAFSQAEIERVVVPEGVKEIGDYAFSDCKKLTSAVLPDSLTNIGSDIFRGSSNVTSLTLPVDLYFNSSTEFYSVTKLEEVTLTKGTDGIIDSYRNNYYYTPWNNSHETLVTLNLEEGITEIGYYAFRNLSNVEKVVIPDSVTNIDYGAFMSSGIKELTMPASVVLKGVAFPETVEKITLTKGTGVMPDYTGIANCTPWYSNGENLKELTLEEGITNIGNYAFAGLKGIDSLTLPSSVETVGGYAFSESDIAEIILPQKLTEIGEYAFSECVNLENIILPDSLTDLGGKAFYCCSSLKEISIPEKVKSIGAYTFYGCDSLETVEIGSGVESIGESAFSSCDNLTTLTLPENIKSLGESFIDYTPISSIGIPASLTEITGSSLRKCPSLVEITVDENNESYSSYEGVLYSKDKSVLIAYPDNKLQESFTPYDSTTAIGDYAFAYTSGLTEIILPERITGIGYNAFCETSSSCTVKIYNKDCNISDYSNTITCKIKGHASSTAKDYAAYYSKTFENLCNEFQCRVEYKGECGSDIIKTTYCTVCDGVVSTETTNEFINHTSSDWITDKEATCTEDGHRYKDCTNCHKVLEEETLTALGHDEDTEWTVDTEAKCLTEGKKSIYCKRCKEAVKTEVIAPLGHDKETEWTVDSYPDCENDGLQHKSCKRCRLLLEEEVLPKWNHNYESTYYPPESDAEGYTEYVCSNCNDTYKVLDPAAAVDSFSVFSGVHKIEVSWMKAVEASVTGYEIFRKTGDSDYSLVAAIKSRDTLLWADNNVSVGQEYTYKMYAVKGSVKGTFTQELSAIPQADTILPEVIRLEPSVTGATYGKNIPLTVSAKDNIGVKTVEIHISRDLGSTWSLALSKDTGEFRGDFDISSYADGEMWFKAYAVDTSGNRSESSVVRKVNIDNTPPAKVTGFAVADYTGKSVFLTWKDVEDDRKGYRLEMKKGDKFEVINSCVSTIGYTVTDLMASTEYSFRIAAVDMYGNVGEYSKTVTVTTKADTAAPVITALEPESRSYNSVIPFTVRAVDEFGVAKIIVESSVDGKVWTACAEKTFSKKNVSETFSISLDSYNEGIIKLRAVATDIYGNTAKENIPYAEYRVDRTAPSAVSGFTAVGCDGYIALSWSESDKNDDEIYSVYRSEAEDDGYVLIKSNVKTLGYNDVTAEEEKTYYYRVKTTDSAGNTGVFSETVSAVRGEDTKPPVIRITPKTDSFVGAKSKNVTVNAADNGIISNILIEYKTTQAGQWTVLKNETGIGSAKAQIKAEIPIDQLSDSQKLYVRAKATDASSLTSEYEQVIYTVDKTPALIKNPQFSLDERGNLSLSWQDARESDLQGFVIYTLKGEEVKHIGTVGKSKTGEYNLTYNIADYVTADYNFIIESHDSVGNTATAESGLMYFDSEAVLRAPVAKIVAVTQMQEKVNEYFDAGKSYDTDGNIVSYHWDFGDGTTSGKARPVKAYDTEGSYTVTLTVTDDEGLQSVAVKNVVVHKRIQFGEISVKIINTKGEPIAGTSVKVDGEDSMHAYTDEFGNAKFRIPVGDHFVSGYLNGQYLPEIRNTVVYNEQTSYVTLVLEEGAPVSGKFTVERLELEEIQELIEKGFDPEALSNNQVFESTVVLSKEKPSDPEIKVNVIYNDEGDVVEWTYEEEKEEDTNHTNGSGKDYKFSFDGNRYRPHRVDVWKDNQGHTYISTLSLSAETKFLKEMFKVKLEVFCQVGEEFRLVDNKVSLAVPEGLSIVSGVEGYADGPGVTLGEMAGGVNSSTSCIWIISGDEEGEYDLSADYTGTLYSVEHSKAFETVTAQFVTEEPIRVHGTSMVKTVYNVAESFHNGRYYFNLGVENVGDMDIYYPDISYSDTTLKVFEEEYEKTSRGEKFDPDRISVVQSGSMYMVDSDGTVRDIEELPDTLKPGQAVFKKYIATGFRYYVDTNLFDKAVVNDYGTNKNLNIVVNFYSPRDEIFKHYRTIATLESTVTSNKFGSAVRYDIGESTQLNLRVGWDNDYFEKYENLSSCKWSNSDSAVANVGQGGSVYFKKYGYTDVRATLPEGLESSNFRFYVGEYTLEEYEEMLDFENSWLLLKVKNPKTLAFIKNFSTTTSKGTLDWGSADTYCSFNLPEIMGSKIHITADGFRDYIIPSEVVNSFRYDERELGDNCYIVEKSITLANDRKDGKGYISSVYAKDAGKEAGVYTDILSEKIKFLEGDSIKVVVTAVGAEGGTYVISQGGDIKLESANGVFVDSFDKFNTDKTTVVYVKNSAGKILAEPTQIKLHKEKLDETAEDLIKKASFSFGKDFKISVPEDFPILGEASISIPAFKSPISVDVTDTSIKVAIGVPIMDGKSEWEYYKKSVKNAAETIKTAKDKTKAFDNWGNEIKERFGESGTGLSSVGGVFKFDSEFIGYMEFGVLNGHLYIKDACYVSASISFSLSYTAQGAVLFVPSYASVSAGTTVSLSGSLSRVVPDDEIPLQWEIALKVSPKLGAEVGVGFKDFASLGAGGEVTLNMSIEFLKKHIYADITGKIYLTSEFIVWDGEQVLLNGTEVFIDDYYSQPEKKLMKSFTYEMQTKKLLSSPEKTEPKLISRDYADNTSQWLGDKNTKLRKSSSPSGVEFKALQTGVYDGTRASVVPLGEDKLLMTYIEDDSTRDEYNRFRLVYSVFDGETWSKPKAVYDNGTVDSLPALASDGENVYVAWLKAGRVLTEDDSDNIRDVMKQIDVYTAKYNSQTDAFENITNVSDNDSYVSSCSIAAEKGEYAVYFTEVSDNTKYTVKKFDGESTEIIAEDLDSVTSLVAGGIDEVSYCRDTDGVLSSTGDINAYTWKNGTTTAFIKESETEESAYSRISYGTIEGERTLFASNGNAIYAYNSGELKIMTPVGSVGEFIAGDNCIFYTEKSDNGSELYLTRYENGSFTKPIQLSDMDELISDVSITSLNGDIYGICNIGRTEYDEDYETYNVNSTDIGAFTVSDFTDLSVTLFGIDESEISSSKETVLKVAVENKGSTVPDEAVFTITDNKCTETQQTVPLSVLPGEKEIVELSYIVPESYADTSVSVYCDAGYDRNEEDNTSGVTYGYTDIALKESSVTFENGEYQIAFNVYNMSEIQAEDVVLNIRMNDESINPFYEYKVGTLPKGRFITAKFTLSEDSVEFGEDGYAKLYCSLVSSGKTQQTGDDEICVILEREEKAVCDHSEVYITEAVEATCTKEGNTEGRLCLLCGEVLAVSETVAKADHVYSSTVIEPDCTNEGYTLYDCDNCDNSYKDSFVIATGHSEVTDNAVEATCTKTGLTQGSHCEKCGEVLIPQQTVELKAHTPKTVKGYAATCIKTGLTDGKVCSECGYVFTPQSVIDAVNHSFTKYVSDNNATCKANGTKTARCDYGCKKTSTVTDYGTMKKHLSDSGSVKVSPTYKTTGLRVYRCKVCYKELSTKVIDKLTLKKVTGIKVTKYSTTYITLSWNRVTGAERYYVYYMTDGGIWIKKTVTGTTLKLAGLKSGKIYKIKIVASAGDNESADSEIFTTATKVSKVSLKSAKSSKRKQISLKWKKVSGASGYQIKYSTSKKFSKKTTKTLYVRSQKKYKATIKKLKRSKKYYVKVRAYKTVNGQKIYGSYSKVKRVRVK